MGLVFHFRPAKTHFYDFNTLLSNSTYITTSRLHDIVLAFWFLFIFILFHFNRVERVHVCIWIWKSARRTSWLCPLIKIWPLFYHFFGMMLDYKRIIIIIYETKNSIVISVKCLLVFFTNFSTIVFTQF